MSKQFSLFFFSFFIIQSTFAQQKPLPVISVKNINNKIIISWVNEFTKPITTLNIQRSFDSLRNYKTAGSVLSPQNKENGYADVTAPYNKMYYRVFIAFEGGSYVYSNIMRPIKDTSKNTTVGIQSPWITNVIDSTTASIPNYPSSFIFTAKDNNVVIHLTDASTKKYTVKFFNEVDKLLFELNKIKEDYLIIEKVNFVRTGWYHFEIYENGELVEKNKFQISRDGKKL